MTVSITTQPSNQTAVEGGTATFSVVATGSGILSYQWKKNGVDITGATGATYTTAPTIISDNASQYVVVVKDSGAPVTSTPATLTITSKIKNSTDKAAKSIGNLNTSITNMGKPPAGTESSALDVSSISDTLTEFNSLLSTSMLQFVPVDTAPATPTSPGAAGNYKIDGDTLHLCVDTNTWVELSTKTFNFVEVDTAPPELTSPGVPGNYKIDGTKFHLCIKTDTWIKLSTLQFVSTTKPLTAGAAGVPGNYNVDDANRILHLCISPNRWIKLSMSGATYSSSSTDNSTASSLTSVVVNSFETQLAISNGTLSIDCSQGTVFLGVIPASINKWQFVNFSSNPSFSQHVSVVVQGNSAYPYGSQCSVNGVDIQEGVLWNKGAPPQATTNTNVLNFSIIRDDVGVVKVIGSGSYVFGNQFLNFSYDPPAGPANISDAELIFWYDVCDPSTILSTQYDQASANYLPVTDETQLVYLWVDKRTKNFPFDGRKKYMYSGAGYDQAPRLRQNVQNGRPGLYFSGVNNQALFSWYDIPEQECTFVIVYKPITKFGTLLQTSIGYDWYFYPDGSRYLGGKGTTINMNQEWTRETERYAVENYATPDQGEYRYYEKSAKRPIDDTQEYFNKYQQCYILFHKFSSSDSSDSYENGNNNLLVFPPTGLNDTNTIETRMGIKRNWWNESGVSEYPVTRVYPVPRRGYQSALMHRREHLNNSQWPSGYVFEYIFYNRALSKDEMIAIRDYLANKWGVSVT